MKATRIAMWSGPRNISTAMMRAFENRTDTVVWDEPLYGHYLGATGVDHSGAEHVMAVHGTDWREAVARLIGPLPDGARVFYQKHMAHHLLPAIDRSWLDRLEHGFLIREPGEMLTSLARVIPEPELEETGLPQQVEIFHQVERRTGVAPSVLDARDVLEDPERMLTLLCAAFGIEFDAAMLSWPPGRRDSDGAWAPHWYAAVEASTGFGPYRVKDEPMPERLQGLLERCIPYYEELHGARLGR